MSFGTSQVVELPVPDAVYDIVQDIQNITGDCVDIPYLTEFLVRQAEYFLEESTDTVQMVLEVGGIILNSDNFSRKLRYYSSTPLHRDFTSRLPVLLTQFYTNTINTIMHGHFKDCNDEYIRFTICRL